MVATFVRSLVPISALFALGAVSRWISSAHAQPQQLPVPASAAQPAVSTSAPPAPAQASAQQTYVGSNKCFQCHRRQADAWDQTKHVRAFTNIPEQYRSDPACLKCHVTAFGKAGGFAAGEEKDLLHIGCEACHGPGALHLNAAQRFLLAMPGEEAQAEKELRETIVKNPGDAVCAQCHRTQAHQRHPSYDGPPRTVPGGQTSATFHGTAYVGPQIGSMAASSTSSRYGIKTCGGCHYDQYKQWQNGSHFALAAALPARYASDATCQSCHAAAGAAAERITAGDTGGHAWVGATCENCHGPALDHIHFNRPMIGRLSLTPASEQASRASIGQTKPPATCIQCHLGERHQSHPEFSKEG